VHLLPSLRERFRQNIVNAACPDEEKRIVSVARGLPKAFEELKCALTSSPVLAMPDDDSTFILDTDASLSVIGAVLSQNQ